MKLTTSSLLPFVLTASSTVAAAAANQANIFVSPASPRNQGPPPQISAEQSALIYAQRLGLSEGLSLGDATPETIDYLNRFGSHDRKLFKDPGQDDQRERFLVIVEGVVDINGILPPRFGDPTLAFTVDNPLSSSANQKLIDELAAHGSSCRDCHNLRAVGLDGLERFEKDMISVEKSHIVHITDLKKILEDQDSNSQDYQTTMLAINTLLTSLLDSNMIVSMALMPPEAKPSLGGFFSKQRSSYGTSHLAKHKRTSAAHHHTNQPRQKGSAGGRIDINPDTNAQGVPDDHDTDAGFAQPSDLNNETYVNEEAKAQMNGDPPPQAHADQKQAPPRNGSFPRGILPVCFPSMQECQTATFNCSGNGACAQKWGSKEKQRACFACACQNEVLDRGSGKQKTVYWAGPACQKKDVSVEFWLLAGVTIGLVSIITWGIGLLVQMGSEDLPSVIGAGVSGPRPK